MRCGCPSALKGWHKSARPSPAQAALLDDLWRRCKTHTHTRWWSRSRPNEFSATPNDVNILEEKIEELFTSFPSKFHIARCVYVSVQKNRIGVQTSKLSYRSLPRSCSRGLTTSCLSAPKDDHTNCHSAWARIVQGLRLLVASRLSRCCQHRQFVNLYCVLRRDKLMKISAVSSSSSLCQSRSLSLPWARWLNN